MNTPRVTKPSDLTAYNLMLSKLTERERAKIRAETRLAQVARKKARNAS